jgi:hypothetical protein
LTNGEASARRKTEVPRSTLLVALVAGLFFGALATHRYYRSQSKEHEVVIAGADISRHGARSVVIVSGLEIYRQTCVGPCDQVAFEIWPRDQHYQIEIRGQGGDCVLCQQVYAADRYRETIGGEQKLDVKLDSIRPY